MSKRVTDIIESSATDPVSNIQQFMDALNAGRKSVYRHVFSESEESTFRISPWFKPNGDLVPAGERKYTKLSVEVSALTDAVVFLKQGIMTRDAVPFIDSFYIHPNHFMPSNLNALQLEQDETWGMRALEGGRALLAPPPEVTLEIDEPVMFLSSAKDAAYSHFLWDTVPMLAVFDRLRPWCTKVLVEDGLPSYKMDILYRAGLTDENIILRPLDKAVRCKRLFVPNRLSVNNFSINDVGMEVLKRLRKPKQKFWPRRQARPGRRLFVDRGGDRADVRRLINEDDIWNVLKLAGFERISPGLMTLAEKAEAFGEAGVIVGQYGGGLQNHFLCPDGTKILVLHSTSFRRFIFDSSVDQLGHHVISVEGIAESPSLNSDFNIEMLPFVRALSKLIDG